MPSYRSLLRPLPVALVAAWLLATGLGSAVTHAVWAGGADGLVRLASNIAHLGAAPGWAAIIVLRDFGTRDELGWIILANAVGWGFWSVCAVLAAWTARALIIGAARRRPSVDPARRRFLADATVGCVGLGAASVPGYAALVEPWTLEVRRYRVPIRDLPADLEGLRVVQLSDTHLGPRMPTSVIADAVARAVALNPDLVVLTGDYIHDGRREIDRAAALFGPLVEHARIGVVGVLGNHDWYGDGPRMAAALRGVGVHMIDNDRCWLADGRLAAAPPAAPALLLAGLGDLGQDRTDVAGAFAGVDPGVPRVLLTHRPDTAELTELAGPGAPRVDLMCCGHTHGGQVRLPLLGTPAIPSRYGQKYAGGLVRGPRFPVIVSRGVGLSILPVRLGVPPEIGVVTLVRGKRLRD